MNKKMSFKDKAKKWIQFLAYTSVIDALFIYSFLFNIKWLWVTMEIYSIVTIILVTLVTAIMLLITKILEIGKFNIKQQIKSKKLELKNISKFEYYYPRSLEIVSIVHTVLFTLAILIFTPHWIFGLALVFSLVVWSIFIHVRERFKKINHEIVEAVENSK